MLDYLTDIQPHESAGKTDAEIAVYLSSLCNRPLPCGVVIAICSAAEVVYRDLETEKLTGPLWIALKESENPLAQWFLRHVWLDRREQITLDGSVSDIPGVDSFSIVSGFGTLALQLGQATPAFETIRLALIDTAGGLRHSEPVTEAQIAESRIAYQTAFASDEQARLKYGYLSEAVSEATAAIDSDPSIDLQAVSDLLAVKLAEVWGE